MSRAPLCLVTRTKVIVFNRLAAPVEAPRVAVSTNVRPLTLEQLHAAVLPYASEPGGRATIIGAREPAAAKKGTPRPAAPGAPLPTLLLPSSRQGFAFAGISRQLVVALAAFGALCAAGSAAVALRTTLGGVERIASARARVERPATIEVAAPRATATGDEVGRLDASSPGAAAAPAP